jgi:hypothetical protein
MDSNIEEILEKNPSEHEVQRAAQHQGILTMAEDAIIKILQGFTSIEEVSKVVDLSEGIDLSIPDTPTTPQSEASAHQTTTANTNTSENNQSARIAILLDYIRELEIEQHIHPETGIAEKIALLRELVVDTLEDSQANNPQTTKAESQKTHTEVEKLIEELHQIETHQTIHPEVGIADQLARIRQAVHSISE